MSDDQEHVVTLLRTYQRRLRELEKQAAIYGKDCPPHITLEIEDLQEKIRRLEIDVTIAESQKVPSHYPIQGQVTHQRAGESWDWLRHRPPLVWIAGLLVLVIVVVAVQIVTTVTLPTAPTVNPVLHPTEQIAEKLTVVTFPTAPTVDSIPTANPEPRGLPTPTFLDSDVRLVDVSIVAEGNLPALDVKIRNVGDKIAILKRAIVHVSDYETFSIFGCATRPPPPTPLRFTAKYDVDLRSDTTKAINISQSVPSNDVDRFKIVLGTAPTHHGSWVLYRLNLELIYNENDQSVTSLPIIVTTPNNDSTRSAERLYGFNVTEADILKDQYLYYGANVNSVQKCFARNLQAAKRVFNREPFIASEQAQLEYQELQKIIPHP